MPEMSDSALRCLLGLLHLSFRYDPNEERWVRPDRWFSRSDVEETAGLSSQGTRNGLGELEEIGWVRADRDGRGFRYQLLSEVPEKRFTYLPTALLEELSSLGSTELRVVLAVLRRTWGWTETKQKPEGGEETVHVRWTQASNGDLGEITGRSKSAVKTAAKALQGEWIERIRPGSGAYQYRFLPEAVGDGSGEPDSFCTDTSNDLPPDRQNSAPPSSFKENTPRDKHPREKRPQKSGTRQPKSPSSSERETAVPPEESPKEEASSTSRETQGSSRQRDKISDFNDLSPEKKKLAEKLQNVGIWAGRIAEILNRYSPGRIQANFELFRQRDSEQTIRSSGAWLYKAITEGYALPQHSSPQGDEPPDGTSPPSLKHKEVVSEEEMEAYVQRGVPEERFHRCLSEEPGARYMYLDPSAGSPNERR
ncbi:MAG: hypothetical protein ABEL51_16550 [Salinibacter sp.]